MAVIYRCVAIATLAALCWVPARPVSAAPIQAATFGPTGSAIDQQVVNGWEFTIDATITVTHLGRVDMLADGVTDGDVGLWRNIDGPGGSLLRHTTVTAASPFDESGTGHRSYYEPISPIVLHPGSYLVATPSNGEPFYFAQTPATAPDITWTAGRGVRGDVLPASSDDFTSRRTNTGSYFGANFKFEVGSGGVLALSSPAERSVVQRNNSNLADVTIAGLYPGDPTRIEARALPRPGFGGTATDWQVIDAAPAGGEFSASLPVYGGWYDIEVRTFDGLNQLDATSVGQVGVGEIFIAAGQSNSANHGSPPQQADDERVLARTATAGSLWQPADDPQPGATGAGGSPWPELGDLVAGDQDVPVGILSVGFGGTSVAQWLPGGSLYDGRLKPAIETLGPDGFRAILWHQGESDSIASTSAATYASRLDEIIAESRADAGFDVPWGVALASFHPASSEAQEAEITAGQQQVIAGDPLVFEGAFTDDFHTNGWLSDSVHFNQTGLDMHALRWHEQIAAAHILLPEPSGLVLLAVGMGLGTFSHRRGHSRSHAFRR